MTLDRAIEKLGFSVAVLVFWIARKLPTDFWEKISFERCVEVVRLNPLLPLKKRALQIMEETASNYQHWQEVYRLIDKDSKKRKLVLEKMFSSTKAETKQFEAWKEMYRFFGSGKSKKKTERKLAAQCLERMTTCAKTEEEWRTVAHWAEMNKDNQLAQQALTQRIKIARKGLRDHKKGDVFCLATKLEKAWEITPKDEAFTKEIQQQMTSLAERATKEAATPEKLRWLLTASFDSSYGGRSCYPVFGPILRERVVLTLPQRHLNFEQLRNFALGKCDGFLHKESGLPLIRKMFKVSAFSLADSLTLIGMVGYPGHKRKKADRKKIVQDLDKRIRKLSSSFEDWSAVVQQHSVPESLRAHALRQMAAIVREEE